jgi:RIO kinase 1
MTATDHDRNPQEENGSRFGVSEQGEPVPGWPTALAAAARPGEVPGYRPPIPKTSYESNADVQRWLREQTLDGRNKPPFDPALLAGQRDRPWILSALSHFYERDLIDDVILAARSGKEATVYCCTGGPAAGAALLAAKVYRPRMFRSLRNDAVYREGRAQRDERGRPLRDRRRKRGTGSERGRAEQVSAWIEYEYATQSLLHDAGADVPRPLAQVGNATLMEYFGDEDGPAPLLHHADIPPEDAQRLFDRLLWNIERFLACDRVHGDLSAYNILYWEGRATIIDFAQAVDPRHNPGLFALFARDIDRTYRYFARYGVVADPAALARDLWRRYQGG